jgi:RNA polymerase sigma-70 factor (ECF subfamily)
MKTADKFGRTIDEASARLLARVSDSRDVGLEELTPRIASSVEKYLLRSDAKPSTADVAQFIDEIHADDLCFVIACERGDEKAWQDLVARYDPTVKSAARKLASNLEDANDLAGSIWAELYGLREDENGNRKTKLAYYSGRGSLGGWLRAIVSQMAVDKFRKESRLVQIEETRVFEHLAEDSSNNSDNHHVVSHTENPEKLYSDKQTEGDVSAAIREAIAALDAEDRLILKMYYFDGLKLKDIGAVFGFHEATASRRLVRVQSDIRKAVEKSLRSKHGWSDAEVKKYLADTAAGLGISFEKMFAIFILAAIVQDIVIKTVL